MSKDQSEEVRSPSKNSKSPSYDADLTDRSANRAIESMRGAHGGTAGANNESREHLEFTPLEEPTGTANARRRNAFFEQIHRNPAVPEAATQDGSLNSLDANHKNGEKPHHEFPVMPGQRGMAKQELEANERKWGEGNFSEQEKKAIHDIQNALLGGTFDAYTTALQGLGNNPEKLSQVMEEAQRNIQLAGGKIDLALSDGKAYMYAENSKFAVQVDPQTGNSAVKPITRDGDVVSVGSGEVISKTPQSEFKSITDDVVRGVAPLPVVEWDMPPSNIMRPPTAAPSNDRPPTDLRMDPIRNYR